MNQEKLKILEMIQEGKISYVWEIFGGLKSIRTLELFNPLKSKSYAGGGPKS